MGRHRGRCRESIKLHGGDPERSLAALEVNRSTRESLAAAAPVVEAKFARGEAERTTSYASGSETGDGQRFRILRPHASGGLGTYSWHSTAS